MDKAGTSAATVPKPAASATGGENDAALTVRPDQPLLRRLRDPRPGLFQLPRWRPYAQPPRDTASVLGYGRRRPQTSHRSAAINDPARKERTQGQAAKTMIPNGCAR